MVAATTAAGSGTFTRSYSGTVGPLITPGSISAHDMLDTDNGTSSMMVLLTRSHAR